jgi:hypothetical protein
MRRRAQALHWMQQQSAEERRDEGYTGCSHNLKEREGMKVILDAATICRREKG